MIKTNIKPFPENWDEVSFRKCLELLDKPDMSRVEAIRTILEVPKEAKIEGLESLYATAKFLHSPPEIDLEIKKVGAYEIPLDITLESEGQFEDISLELKKVAPLSLKERTGALAFIVAVYLQPKWYSTDYDTQQARFLSKILLDYPCTEVMSAGAFFQARYLSLESGLSMSYLLRHIQLKKSKPDSSNFLKHLGRMRLWTMLRVIWALVTRRLWGGPSKSSTQS